MQEYAGLRRFFISIIQVKPLPTAEDLAWLLQHVLARHSQRDDTAGSRYRHKASNPRCSYCNMRC
jgi:hypothetical protein